MSTLNDYKKVKTIPPERFGRVAVLYGGTTPERPVSLESGKGVYDALCAKGVNAELIDADVHLLEKLTKKQYDLAFIVLHGGDDEGGGTQAILELVGIPYVGSSVKASLLCMNKLLSKQVFIANSLPTSPYIIVSEDNKKELVKKLGLPLAIKPIAEGSTFGVSKVTKESDLEGALSLASQYGATIMAEPWLGGAEYTVAMIAEQALPSIRIEPTTELYDYQAKYVSDDTQFFCPSGLSESEEAEVRDIALRAHRVLGCADWARVDLMRDDAGNFQLLEVNTLPGMTSHSLVPIAAGVAGLSYEDAVYEILSCGFMKTEQQGNGIQREQVLSY